MRQHLAPAPDLVLVPRAFLMPKVRVLKRHTRRCIVVAKWCVSCWVVRLLGVWVIANPFPPVISTVVCLHWNLSAKHGTAADSRLRNCLLLSKSRCCQRPGTESTRQEKTSVFQTRIHSSMRAVASERRLHFAAGSFQLPETGSQQRDLDSNNEFLRRGRTAVPCFALKCQCTQNGYGIAQ